MPEVADSEALLRRVHPNLLDDEGQIMWLAFRGRELSVDREQLRSLDALRMVFPRHSSARLAARRCREAGFQVRDDPLPENIAHALVVSPGVSHGELRRYAMILRDLAEWPAS